MATLSIIEINHNCIADLHRKGHISYELFLALQDDEAWKYYGLVLEGIRKLGQRHHSEEFQLVVSG